MIKVIRALSHTSGKRVSSAETAELKIVRFLGEIGDSDIPSETSAKLIKLALCHPELVEGSVPSAPGQRGRTDPSTSSG